MDGPSRFARVAINDESGEVWRECQPPGSARPQEPPGASGIISVDNELS